MNQLRKPANGFKTSTSILAGFAAIYVAVVSLAQVCEATVMPDSSSVQTNVMLALNPRTIREGMRAEDVVAIWGPPFYVSTKQRLKYAYQSGYFTGYFAMWYDYAGYNLVGTISVHFVNDEVVKVTHTRY